LVEPEEKRISVYSFLGKALFGVEEGEGRTIVIGEKKKSPTKEYLFLLVFALLKISGFLSFFEDC